MEKVDDIQKQMGSVSTQIGILRKNQNKSPEQKRKNCNRNEDNTDGLISRLDTAEERLSEFEGMTTETSNRRQ